MTHPQMIRPSAFVPDAPEDDETGCMADGCVGVADGYVRCQRDADALCADHLDAHVATCRLCSE